MAFTLFDFTKSWRNAGDYPTFEPDEAKVRDDLQSLFDELKVGLNRLIGELKASNMPFTPTAEVDSSDVQNAIENVQSQIASAVLGELPDGSVTARKISAGAVETDKIEDGAVTAEKLAADAVTADKLADDAVLTDSIADSAVTGDKLADGAVGLDKLSAEALNAKADLVDGKVNPTQISKTRVNVTASRSLGVTDDGKLLYIASSSAVTITIPLNSAAQIPVGGEIVLYRADLGAVTIAGSEGVNITCSAALNSLERYDTVALKKWGANDWCVEFNHNPIPAAGVTDNEIADGAITTSKILDGSVNSAKLAQNAVSTLYTATIPANGWAETYGLYVNNVNISGVLASDNPVVDVTLETIADPSAMPAVSEEWGKVFRIKVFDNVLQCYASDVPDVDIPVKILCIRK